MPTISWLYVSIVNRLLTYKTISHDKLIVLDYQGWRGYWIVNYIGTQSFYNTLSYLVAQKLWLLLSNFDWLIPN